VPPLGSLVAIEEAIRSSWSAETCDPVDREAWSPANPARGQCGVTAAVVQELLGGQLMMAEVHYADGRRQGVHYWNRLAGGVELDLTRAQFGPEEIVGAASVVEGRPDKRSGRLAPQHRLLWQRVCEKLS
jgi:hypothetical protein